MPLFVSKPYKMQQNNFLVYFILLFFVCGEEHGKILPDRQLKPALKSIKLKHSPTGCFVNRLVRGFCNMK